VVEAVSEGVRLEDCTGNVLGYLPTGEGEEGGEGEGETYEEESVEGSEDGEGEGGWELEESDISIEEDSDGVGFKIVISPQVRESTEPRNELAQLLEECRVFHDQS
jgi:hypothetical protein